MGHPLVQRGSRSAINHNVTQYTLVGRCAAAVMNRVRSNSGSVLAVGLKNNRNIAVRESERAARSRGIRKSFSGGLVCRVAQRGHGARTEVPFRGISTPSTETPRHPPRRHLGGGGGARSGMRKVRRGARGDEPQRDETHASPDLICRLTREITISKSPRYIRDCLMHASAPRRFRYCYLVA